MAELPQHAIKLVVLVTVHQGMTPHDAAHQIAGALTAAGWRAEVEPLSEPEPRTISKPEDDYNAHRATCGLMKWAD